MYCVNEKAKKVIAFVINFCVTLKIFEDINEFPKYEIKSIKKIVYYDCYLIYKVIFFVYVTQFCEKSK